MPTRHFRPILCCTAALALPALAACSDSLRPGALRPSDVGGEAVAGDLQTGTAGEPLRDSVAVRVLGRGGTPAADVTLEWRVLSEGGGEFRFPTTRTGVDGRSANLWILGPRAGEHAAEVRAVLPGGAGVVDTVRATADPGTAVALEVAGDTLRALTVGDTLRAALRARDRFGNEVPAASLGASWRSLQPEVAAVDSAGRVRALRMGSATVEARAGAVSARLRVSVASVVDVFPVESGTLLSPRAAAVQRNGGRVVAVGTAQDAGGVPLGFAFDGSAWRAQLMAPGTVPVRVNSLHVTPRGRAYAGTDAGVYNSLPGTEWAPHAALRQGVRVAGAGAVLFLLAPRTGFTLPTDSLTVYRYLGERLADLALPRDRRASAYWASMAAAGADELYLASGGTAVRWNGSAWSAVREEGAATDLPLQSVASHPQGGTVWGLGGTTRWPQLFRMRGSTAERVVHPLEERGQDIVGMAVGADGDPYLAYAGGVYHLAADGWRNLPLPGEWTVDGAVWPEADGTVWVSASRPAGRSSPEGFATRQLAFIRIRPAAAALRTGASR